MTDKIKVSRTDLYKGRAKKQTDRYLIKAEIGNVHIVLGTAKKEKDENDKEFFAFVSDIRPCSAETIEKLQEKVRLQITYPSI